VQKGRDGGWSVGVGLCRPAGSLASTAMPDERRVARDASLYGSLKSLLGPDAVTG
jgi:hypothetical protein